MTRKEGTGIWIGGNHSCHPQSPTGSFGNSGQSDAEGEARSLAPDRHLGRVCVTPQPHTPHSSRRRGPLHCLIPPFSKFSFFSIRFLHFSGIFGFVFLYRKENEKKFFFLNASSWMLCSKELATPCVPAALTNPALVCTSALAP